MISFQEFLKESNSKTIKFMTKFVTSNDGIDKIPVSYSHTVIDGKVNIELFTKLGGSDLRKIFANDVEGVDRQKVSIPEGHPLYSDAKAGYKKSIAATDPTFLPHFEKMIKAKMSKREYVNQLP